MKTTNQNVLVFSLLWLMGCGQQGMENDQSLLAAPPVPTLSISYQVPRDLPADATESDMAVFAWNEFFALNWAASWPEDQRRTTPNVNWDFATSGAAPQLAVWETYIHRTELRPASGLRNQNLDTGKPVYSFRAGIDSLTFQVTPSDYWVNLDEDNEIGSCYLYAYDSLEVLYMAKSNLVEYNYVKAKFPTDQLLSLAVNRGADTVYLKDATSRNSTCNSDTAYNVVCLPCGSEVDEGAIEIKTAWRFLVPGKDDPSRFLTKEVVYYPQIRNDSVAVAQTGTMALIGMHIIHKTKNYPAFIFASWEQVDVRNADMKIIGLDTPIVNGNSDPSVDPHMPTPVVDRSIPATLQKVNQLAWEMIRSKNPASRWQFYQLIGVQGTPVDFEQRSADDNYFMANYVIESDLLLTRFHGSFQKPFDTLKNVVYNGRTFDVGGCQGCHGQAQLKGSDFSFLLDFGAGKPVVTPDPYLSFEQAQKIADPSKLLRFIDVYTTKPTTP
ncbi:MAG: hypothetical protein OEY56_07765 [Cyclobacteriaceae bacterium]|nr:hypothetical protein [Cyclobacteriaceae bacterium]